MLAGQANRKVDMSTYMQLVLIFHAESTNKKVVAPLHWEAEP